MSGQDFEKQVRQKLRDLKMNPSAKAWENIEDSLRENNRRRTPLLWLPLVLLGLGAGVYLLFKPASEVNKQTTAYKTQGKKPQPALENSPGTSSAAISDANSNRNSNFKDHGIPHAANTDHATRRVFPQNVATEKNGSFQISKDEVTEIAVKEHPFHSSTLTPGKEIYSTSEIKLPDAEKALIKLAASQKVSSLNSLSQNKQTTSSKGKRKWSFGVTAFGGVSAVNEGKFINFDRARVEDVSYIPPFASPTFAPPLKPSAIRSGFGYSAGAFAMRKLNERFSISFALNYLQLNTRNKVGYEMNASQIVNTSRGSQFVSNYYTLERDQPAHYRNRYHFIELPVELHTRINRSERLPLHVITGMSVSQLLKSNSLHFDGTTGVYYNDDKLLNQTQLALRAGVSVGMLNKWKHPVRIGPSVRYNISKVLQKDVSDKKNFMSLGVDLKVFLK
jgi:hypothetical protein